MDKYKLNEILHKHDVWLNNREDGERANLSYANLRYADLSYANLRSANLSYADLSYANLRSANLSYANLSYADLSYANLLDNSMWSLTGNSDHIKSIQNDIYDICYTDKVMQIGCEQHDIKDWFKFTDSKIKSMDSAAFEWWKEWKPILRKMIEVNPAKPTGFKDE